MLFSKTTVLAAAAAFSGLVQGATITVAVGKGGLKFTPAEITAKQGDRIIFEFYPGGHSVAESTFDKPCEALMGSSSFYSGIFPGANPPKDSFTIEIKDNGPIWFFCPTTGHCEAGMSGVINGPGGSDTLAAYQQASKDATATDPGDPRGEASPSSESGTPSGTPTSSGGSKPTSKPTSKPPSKPTSSASSGSPSGSGTPSAVSSSSSNVTTTSAPPTNTSSEGSALTNAAAELVLGAAVAIAFLLA